MEDRVWIGTCHRLLVICSGETRGQLMIPWHPGGRATRRKQRAEPISVKGQTYAQHHAEREQYAKGEHIDEYVSP